MRSCLPHQPLPLFFLCESIGNISHRCRHVNWDLLLSFLMLFRDFCPVVALALHSSFSQMIFYCKSLFTVFHTLHSLLSQLMYIWVVLLYGKYKHVFLLLISWASSRKKTAESNGISMLEYYWTQDPAKGGSSHNGLGPSPLVHSLRKCPTGLISIIIIS